LYGGVASGESDAAKKRMFKLQRLDVKKGEEESGRKKKKDKDADMENVDEEDFMQELEADKEMRTRVNIYKSGVAKGGEDHDDEDDDDDDQKITLDELLDNLVLDSKPDDADMGADDLEGGHSVFVTDGERAARDNIGYVGRDDALQIASKDTAVPVAGNSWGKEFMDDL
jgi:nonsense-mediated mRNA decay protein 3